LIIARNVVAFGLIVGSSTKLSSAALLQKCLRNPPLPRKQHRHPKAGSHRKAMANSTKAKGMATRIKSAESRFWKSCSTKPRRVTQKKGHLSAALFLTFRLINQLKTG
jgi:hypothetical protein